VSLSDVAKEAIHGILLAGGITLGLSNAVLDIID
jgi:hypothetical protein